MSETGLLQLLSGLCQTNRLDEFVLTGIAQKRWTGARWREGSAEVAQEWGEVSGTPQVMALSFGMLELMEVAEPDLLQAFRPFLESWLESRMTRESVGDICWSLDLADGRFLSVNSSVEKVLGYPREEILAARAPKTWLDCLVAAPRGKFAFEFLTPQGQSVWLETQWWASLQTGRAWLVSRDMSDRRRADDQAELMQAMERTAVAGTWEFEIATGKGHWSDEVARIHGLSPKESTNKEFGLSFYPEPGRTRLREAVELASQEGVPYDLELPLVTAQGESRWVRTIGWPIRQGERIVRLRGLLKDITLRREAQLEVAHERARLRVVLDTIPDLVWLKDPEGRYLDCNKRFELLYGTERDGIVGKDDYDFVPVEVADFFRQNDRMALEAEGPRRNEEWVRFADGHQELLETIKSPLFQDGSLIGVLGIGRDLTQHHLDRQQLQESQQRLHLFFEHAPAAVAMFDRDMRYLLVSRRYIQDYGLDSQTLLGRSHYEVFPELPERWREVHGRCLQGAVESRPEDCFVRLDGSLEWVRWEMHPWYEAGGEVGGLILFSEVITAAKNAEKALRSSEEQLRAAQRMEAVGRLAGGVAHDFNNILTVIVSYAELAQQDLPPDHPLYGDLDEILAASKRAEGLTRQLLTFSRRQVTSLEVLDMNAVVSGLSKMLVRLIGEDVQLQFQAHPSPCWVQADRGQLEQVLMNLAVNARDAMQGGGVLVIHVSLAELSPLQCQTLGLSPGTHVSLRVSDSGCGMDEETRNRMFEPFFTTKGQGKGTGLGLSTVYGIVRSCQGAVDVESVPGQGTTLTLYFPLHSEPGTTACRPNVVVQAPQERKRILVVEDEAGVRGVLYKVLSKAGYEVVLASEGEEALALAGTSGDSFDLILSDIIMPGLNGCELMERLLPLCPRARHMFMSGYPDDVLERFQISRERILSKPFDRQTLTAQIRNLLQPSLVQTP